MDFDLPDDVTEVARSVREFAKDRLSPGARERAHRASTRGTSPAIVPGWDSSA